MVRLNIWHEQTEPRMVLHGPGSWASYSSVQTGKQLNKSSESTFPEAEPHGRLQGLAAQPAQGARLPSAIVECTFI